MNPLLLVTLDYPPARGGVAAYLARLVGCLPPEAAIVLAPDEGDTHAEDVVSPTPIYRRRLICNLVRPRWLAALYWTDWLIRKERPSRLLVSHLTPLGEVAWAMSRRHGVPYLVVAHGMDAALVLAGSRSKRNRAQLVLRHAERVVANSEYTAQLLRGLGVPSEKIIIVRPSPNFPLTTVVSAKVAAATRQKYRCGDRFMLLAAGRLVARKGFDEVISALAAFPQAERPLLVIAGDGPERSRLEQQAAAIGVAEDAVFCGGVTDEELKGLFAASDAFVMVPRSLGADVEGFGIVYLEAGLFAKPVIGSRSGGVPEAVRHEETGLLVDPGDVAALAAAIRRLRDDPALARRLGEQGRRRVLEEFGWLRQAQPLLDYLFPELTP